MLLHTINELGAETQREDWEDVLHESKGETRAVAYLAGTQTRRMRNDDPTSR